MFGKLLSSLVLFFLIGCASTAVVNYSNFVFNPSTEKGRELKSLYTNELNSVVTFLGSAGLSVVENGIGFTDSSMCPDCIKESGDFWLFITLRHKNFQNDNGSAISVRAEKVADDVVSDTLFFLKQGDFANLYSDSNFKGLLLGASWLNYEKFKDLLRPEKYETVDVFIPKTLVIKYSKGEITVKELLKSSKLYFKENRFQR